MIQAGDRRRDRMLGELARIAPLSIERPDLVRLVRAPGRVNLIGEHTDYNLGYVMPVAIGLETWVASVPRDDRMVDIRSLQEAGAVKTFDLDAIGEPRTDWADYVRGMALELLATGVVLRGVTAVIDSQIPMGAGLSSSAALELAAAWTLASTTPPLRKMPLAQAAQRAENRYVGVNSGLMDQFASAHGERGSALLFDCRSLEFSSVPIPDGLTLVAIDTRSPHRLGTSQYNARRTQCERGVAVIAGRHPGVESLRDVTSEMLQQAASALGEETLRRCRHVVSENERVPAAAEALRTGDLDAVGRLFAESHASLRDLYEVSSPDLDALVEIATAVPGVIGARMTGAGFGGCTVNLVRDDAVDRLREAVMREYPLGAGRDPGFYVVTAVNGAGAVEQ